MIVLTLRTDRPEAEVGLYENGRQLAYDRWLAHRQLSATIHVKIRDLLASREQELDDLGGIVVYRGPGSFTGLRIGISVANALADGLSIPVAGTTGGDWIEQGQKSLAENPKTQFVVPEYGAPVHTTKPRK